MWTAPLLNCTVDPSTHRHQSEYLIFTKTSQEEEWHLTSMKRFHNVLQFHHFRERGFNQDIFFKHAELMLWNTAISFSVFVLFECLGKMYCRLFCLVTMAIHWSSYLHYCHINTNNQTISINNMLKPVILQQWKCWFAQYMPARKCSIC